ncbi:MAG: hypothetical protein ACHQFX_11625 [Chitinophagales bacterium]
MAKQRISVKQCRNFTQKQLWMLLVAGPNPDFLKFIQVLCWISLPVFVSAVLIMFFLHYRKRKREIEENEAKDPTALAFPMQIGYTNGNGEYVLFDHSDLMHKYRKNLTYNQARYTALHYDFTAIENKYAALAKYAQTHFITPKKRSMENVNEQLPKQLQADVNKLAKENAMERTELLSKLMQLERSHHRLEQENRSLKEQLSLQTATDDEKIAVINTSKNENISLRDKIDEQEYLQDLVEEKKAQIIFLQGQVEQRIKNLYQSEHQRLQTVAEMKQLREEKESIKKNIASLEDELMLKQEQIDKAQVVLCEKEERFTAQQQTLNAKLEYIGNLENMLRETKDQNEQLHASVSESKDLAGALQAQLSDEKSKVQFLTQKLFANKQMMRRVYKEFSPFMDDVENEGSPVIPLTAEYGNKENGEVAIQ